MSTIELASAAWGFRKVDHRTYFEICATAGLKSAEIHAPGMVDRHLRRDELDADLTALQTISATTGVQPLAIASGQSFLNPDATVLEQEIESTVRIIELAKKIGARYIRVFAGGHHLEDAPTEIFDRLHYALSKAGAAAEDMGVQLVVENHGGPTLTGPRCARLMEDINSEAVGINYDPANFLKSGIDPLIALHHILPWVKYTHWKDVRWDNNANGGKGETLYCALGDGQMSVGPIVRTLLEACYQGPWVIEYEDPSDIERGTVDSVKALKHHLANAAAHG